MRLDARAFGVAAGATAAVLFVICALAVTIAPEATTAFAGYLIHIDVSGMTGHSTEWPGLTLQAILDPTSDYQAGPHGRQECPDRCDQALQLLVSLSSVPLPLRS